MNAPKSIFETTPCLSENELLAYVQGSMSVPERQRAERHLLECELCSDAVEGLRSMNNHAGARQALLETRQRLNKRHRPARRMLGLDLKVMLAAASVTLLLGMSWLIYEYGKTKDRNQKATQAFKDNFSPYRAEKKAAGKDGKKDLHLNITQSLPAQQEPLQQVEMDRSGDSRTGKTDAENTGVAGEQPGIDQAPVAGTRAPLWKNNDSLAGGLVNGTTVSGDKYTTSSDLDLQDTKSINNLAKQSGGNVSSNAIFWKKNSHASDKDKPVAADIVTIQSQKSTPATLDHDKSMAAADSLQTDYQQGLNQYNAAKYEEANQLFAKVPAGSADYYAAQFYSGVSCLSLGQAATCVQKLDYVLQQPAGAYYNDAQWYKSLALLQLHRVDEAKVLLKQLDAGNSVYQKKAKKMLKDL